MSTVPYSDTAQKKRREAQVAMFAYNIVVEAQRERFTCKELQEIEKIVKSNLTENEVPYV